MTESVRVFDLFMVATLIWLAWRLLTTKDIFKAVILFIVFGLTTALTYGRLHAIDVALTEGAVGSGITGVLFLNALSRLKKKPAIKKYKHEKDSKT